MKKLDREVILNELVKACSFVDNCDKLCNPSDHEDCYGLAATNVLVVLKELGYRQIVYRR